MPACPLISDLKKSNNNSNNNNYTTTILIDKSRARAILVKKILSVVGSCLINRQIYVEIQSDVSKKI